MVAIAASSVFPFVSRIAFSDRAASTLTKSTPPIVSTDIYWLSTVTVFPSVVRMV